MFLLEIRNLSVSFATRHGPFKAVDGFDLTLERNEVLAIVGESGSGKSVAMLAAMGLLPPTATVSADRMAFDGADLLSMSARRAAAHRRQGHGDDLPGADVVAQSLLHRWLSDRRSAERRISILNAPSATGASSSFWPRSAFPIAERRARAYPHQLSGGMSQRVMIAMALACRPKLLIADEPTTALDVTIQAQILDLLMRERRDNGMGLVLITHDMGVVAETADRVIVQYAGQQMEMNATRADVCRSPPSLYRSASGGVAGAGERAAFAGDSGRRTRAVRPAARLRVLAALRLCLRRLP